MRKIKEDSIEMYKVNAEGYPEAHHVFVQGDIASSEWIPAEDITNYSHPRWDFSKKKWEEGLVNLDALKKEKKKALSAICGIHIKSGFKCMVEGSDYHFSYDIDKQQNFSDTMRLFENNMIDKIGWNAYIGEEKKRIQLNKEEFTRVYLAGVRHKTDSLTRLNDVLYSLVDAAENKETIARIYWDTGLPAAELSLKEGQAIEDQMKELKGKDGELENADMMTMMALMQMSMRIP